MLKRKSGHKWTITNRVRNVNDFIVDGKTEVMDVTGRARTKSLTLKGKLMQACDEDHPKESTASSSTGAAMV